MKVWVVGVRDCEGNYIAAICVSKSIAEREILKERDILVKEWGVQDEHHRKSVEEYYKGKKKAKSHIDDMYKEMIKNLSSNDYENWNNFPYECPYIYETEVLEK